MPRFLAFILAALVLLQALGQEVLVVQYQLNKARITARYCVNKARPQLHCDGRCYLARQLRKADAAGKKAPASSLAKVKYEVLPAVAFALRPPRQWPLPGRRYGAYPPAQCAAGASSGVFRPPLCQA